LFTQNIQSANRRFGNFDIAVAFFDIEDVIPEIENRKEFLSNLRKLIPEIEINYASIFK
jgi:hypothetical protein